MAATAEPTSVALLCQQQWTWHHSEMQPTDDLRRHAVHDAITVVNSNGNECDGYSASDVHWQWAPNGTQLPKQLRTTLRAWASTVHDAITVVDSTGNERNGYGASGVHWQWAPNGTQLLQLVEATADDVAGLSVHVQFTVDNNAKVSQTSQYLCVTEVTAVNQHPRYCYVPCHQRPTLHVRKCTQLLQYPRTNRWSEILPRHYWRRRLIVTLL